MKEQLIPTEEELDFLRKRRAKNAYNDAFNDGIKACETLLLSKMPQFKDEELKNIKLIYHETCKLKRLDKIS